MDNIALIAIGIIALWVVAIGFYLFISRQQAKLSKDVSELEELIEKSEEKPE